MQQLRQPPSRVQAQPKQTTTTLFGKTFNQVEVVLTPHNHQRSSFAGQDDPSPDYMIRPSIRCSSCLLLTTIRGETQQVKRPTPTLVGKIFNQGQVKFTPHRQ
ncbi:hypothetical protein AAZX31_09G064700 [Glycine max]